MNDFEDAVQFQTCLENNVSLIITRNTKDFTNSAVKAITPKYFVK